MEFGNFVVNITGRQCSEVLAIGSRRQIAQCRQNFQASLPTPSLIAQSSANAVNQSPPQLTTDGLEKCKRERHLVTWIQKNRGATGYLTIQQMNNLVQRVQPARCAAIVKILYNDMQNVLKGTPSFVDLCQFMQMTAEKGAHRTATFHAVRGYVYQYRADMSASESAALLCVVPYLEQISEEAANALCQRFVQKLPGERMVSEPQFRAGTYKNGQYQFQTDVASVDDCVSVYRSVPLFPVKMQQRELFMQSITNALVESGHISRQVYIKMLVTWVQSDLPYRRKAFRQLVGAILLDPEPLTSHDAATTLSVAVGAGYRHHPHLLSLSDSFLNKLEQATPEQAGVVVTAWGQCSAMLRMSDEQVMLVTQRALQHTAFNIQQQVQENDKENDYEVAQSFGVSSLVDSSPVQVKVISAETGKSSLEKAQGFDYAIIINVLTGLHKLRLHATTQFEDALKSFSALASSVPFDQLLQVTRLCSSSGIVVPDQVGRALISGSINLHGKIDQRVALDVLSVMEGIGVVDVVVRDRMLKVVPFARGTSTSLFRNTKSNQPQPSSLRGRLISSDSVLDAYEGFNPRAVPVRLPTSGSYLARFLVSSGTGEAYCEACQMHKARIQNLPLPDVATMVALAPTVVAEDVLSLVASDIQLLIEQQARLPDLFNLYCIALNAKASASQAAQSLLSHVELNLHLLSAKDLARLLYSQHLSTVPNVDIIQKALKLLESKVHELPATHARLLVTVLFNTTLVPNEDQQLLIAEAFSSQRRDDLGLYAALIDRIAPRTWSPTGNTSPLPTQQVNIVRGLFRAAVTCQRGSMELWANLIEAAAQLGCCGEEEISKVCSKVASYASAATPDQAAKVLHAWAVLGVVDNISIMFTLRQAALKKWVHSGTPEHQRFTDESFLKRMIWGVGLLGQPEDLDALQTTLDSITKAAGSLSPQFLAITCKLLLQIQYKPNSSFSSELFNQTARMRSALDQYQTIDIIRCAEFISPNSQAVQHMKRVLYSPFGWDENVLDDVGSDNDDWQPAVETLASDKQQSGIFEVDDEDGYSQTWLQKRFVLAHVDADVVQADSAFALDMGGSLTVQQQLHCVSEKRQQQDGQNLSGRDLLDTLVCMLQWDMQPVLAAIMPDVQQYLQGQPGLQVVVDVFTLVVARQILTYDIGAVTVDKLLTLVHQLNAKQIAQMFGALGVANISEFQQKDQLFLLVSKMRQRFVGVVNDATREQAALVVASSSIIDQAWNNQKERMSIASHGNSSFSADDIIDDEDLDNYQGQDRDTLNNGLVLQQNMRTLNPHTEAGDQQPDKAQSNSLHYHNHRDVLRAVQSVFEMVEQHNITEQGNEGNEQANQSTQNRDVWDLLFEDEQP